MFRKSKREIFKFTKIVATINGNTSSQDLIADLFDRGMDVMRMNSAHMTIEEMEQLVANARAVSPKLAVMIDTKGPNIRTCNVPTDGIPLKEGQAIHISGMPGDDGRIQVNYPSFTDEVPVGSRIVCDDGAAKFEVTGKEGDSLIAVASFDCTVLNRKSVNVPDVSLKAPSLTGKDRMFLAAAVRLKCDFVAHSFVRNAQDVQDVRDALGEEGKDIGIIAKIENREGVNNINEILAAADGIMVARGDLGIEIPLEEVPVIQKTLIHEARKCNKPVITATQMLQSMENSPSPTRAEVSDVANAVYDGTDAVMLSGETAHGKFPREAVSMMAAIVLEAERAPKQFFPQLPKNLEPDSPLDFLLNSALNAASVMPVKVIVCCSSQGVSARACSAARPSMPIFAPTPNEITMRKLAMSYGVLSALAEYQPEPAMQAAMALSIFSEICAGTKLSDDDLIILISKHSKTVGNNNLMCVSSIGEFRRSMKED